MKMTMKIKMHEKEQIKELKRQQAQELFFMQLDQLQSKQKEFEVKTTEFQKKLDMKQKQ